MAFNNIDPSVLLTAVGTVLKVDSTLEGASYLTSSGRIFTRRAPDNQSGPHLILTVSSVYSTTGIYQFEAEVRVFCKTAILANGQIDGRGDLILMRCQELLNDQNLSITGMGSISVTTEPVPSFLDPDDARFARGVLRVKILFGYN